VVSKAFVLLTHRKLLINKTTDMEAITNLTVSELKAELNNFKTKRDSLIKCYETLPSESLQERIIDLGKTIGTIQYEISYKTTFNK